ncbi:hypothetical protein [Salinicola rhizosphaerae]|uniref:Uncharacterized protein n=1 Tax=Salinicola rhizosphaerae TaxID=1443141 RepID=A0ABQ3DUN6_9GAMM|nr:hypothetical protein [Salinicola rhizosphaerae]GHB16002.1 hypothetical protein GCM10009038_12970 [Salinicola rhizosphaerae]
MQETIINAHRLIGETIRESGEARSGRIVGVDQSRSIPVIFVIWGGQAGIQRIEVTVDELRQLAEACRKRYAQVASREGSRQAGTPRVSTETETRKEPETGRVIPRRRVGSR